MPRMRVLHPWRACVLRPRGAKQPQAVILTDGGIEDRQPEDDKAGQ
jgi:hypothetical protein